MKRVWRVVFLAVLVLCPPGSSGAASASSGASGGASPEALFLDGVRAYGQERFAQAAEAFSTLVQSGVVNPRLYANLGDALLQGGEIGPAILWYERSLRLDPDDPDVRFNLSRAEERMLDMREDARATWPRIVFFLYGTLSPKALTAWTLGFDVLFFAALILLRLRRRLALAEGLERALRGAVLAGIAGCVLFGASAFYARYEASCGDMGVVLPRELAVRSGKSRDAAVLFTLHAGSRVAVEEGEDGYLRVRFGPDKLGWAPEKDVGLVAAASKTATEKE